MDVLCAAVTQLEEAAADSGRARRRAPPLEKRPLLRVRMLGAGLYEVRPRPVGAPGWAFVDEAGLGTVALVQLHPAGAPLVVDLHDALVRATLLAGRPLGLTAGGELLADARPGGRAARHRPAVVVAVVEAPSGAWVMFGRTTVAQMRGAAALAGRAKRIPFEPLPTSSLDEHMFGVRVHRKRRTCQGCCQSQGSRQELPDSIAIGESQG